MSKIIEIKLPLGAKHREKHAAVYSLFTTEAILENMERGILVSERSRAWGNMKMPIYISRNLKKPSCSCRSKAKIGLCLVINIRNRKLRDRIKDIVLPILKKKWPTIEDKQKYDIWVVLGFSTIEDLNNLKGLLSNEIEHALIKEDILAK